MNNLKALKGEITPYSVSRDLLEKTLIEVDLKPAESYVKSDEKAIALAGVKILSKQLVLVSESDGDSEQEYEITKLEKRIKQVCGRFGFDVSEYLTDSADDDNFRINNRW